MYHYHPLYYDEWNISVPLGPVVTITTRALIECSTEKGSKPASYKSQGAARLEILQFEWNHNLKYDKRVDHRNILNGPPVTIMHVLASWLNGIECSTQSQGTDCSNSNTTPTRYARAYPRIRLYPSTAARVLRYCEITHYPQTVIGYLQPVTQWRDLWLDNQTSKTQAIPISDWSIQCWEHGESVLCMLHDSRKQILIVLKFYILF